MSVNLSPIGNGFQFLTNAGTPLSGGLIYTYQAGSSTPLATYTDNSGNVANANPIVLGSDGRPANEIWLTYGYNYKFVLKDSAGVLIQTYDNLYGILGTIPATSPSLPSGVIVLWSGATGSIPTGYYLCDGSNGTPDLRNRFLVGAGSTYAVAATGGSADAVVVSHTHTATAVDSGHLHTYTANNGNVNASGSPGVTSGNVSTGNTSTSYANVTVTNASTGVSGTNANLPPYYALAYIMKS
jgi:hypothetical protein